MSHVKTGQRVGATSWIIRCQNGHVMQLNPHSTVPPCGHGTWRSKCGSTRYKLQTSSDQAASE
jgi:hypothetical protein